MFSIPRDLALENFSCVENRPGRGKKRNMIYVLNDINYI